VPSPSRPARRRQNSATRAAGLRETTLPDERGWRARQYEHRGGIRVRVDTVLCVPTLHVRQRRELTTIVAKAPSSPGMNMLVVVREQAGFGTRRCFDERVNLTPVTWLQWQPTTPATHQPLDPPGYKGLRGVLAAHGVHRVGVRHVAAARNALRSPGV